MEENKYYTPEIEEFYVGFEFEYKDQYYEGREEFSLCIIKDAQTIRFTTNLNQIDGFNEIDHEHLLSNIEYEIEHGDIRVKYLDKQDLIELGFKPDPSGERYYEFNEYQLYIDIHPDFNTTIYNDDPIIIFQGSIKNKSELIKVLKMLGIK